MDLREDTGLRSGDAPVVISDDGPGAGVPGAASTPAPTPTPAPGGHRGWRLLGESGIVGTIALLFAGWVYRIWDATLSVPIANSFSDTQQMTMMVKSIADHGWLTTNPDLNAPFGTQFYDFPQTGESLQVGIIKVLTLFIHSPAVVMNVYYFGGFAALAIVTFLVLRHLRFRFGVAATVALLYTFLPYHFWHGQQHLWRSSYVSAPLAGLLLLWTVAWRSRFLHDPGGPLKGWSALRANVRWDRVCGAVAIGVVIGLTETMTVAFMLTALAVVCAIVAARDRDPATLVAGALVVVVVMGTFLVALAPVLAYWHQHGTNNDAAGRTPVEQERYGLQVSQLLLPVPGHRLAPLRGTQTKARSDSPIPSEGGQQLGVIGALGFLGGMYGLLTRGIRRRSRAPVDDREQLWVTSGLVSLMLVLFATVSGFALLLSLAGFAQVRDWNRAVILIAFFAFLIVALGLERIVDWFQSRSRRPRVAAGIVLAATLTFGLWDTAVAAPMHYKTQARKDANVATFVHQIEQRLPKGAAIYQLPPIPYPENPSVHWMIDYDELRPYLHSNGLRWSYGGMKGRPDADWQAKVDTNYPVNSLSGLIGLGFSGIVVDTYGYSDHAASVIAQLTGALGEPEVTSHDGRFVFFDARDYASTHGLTAEQLRADAKALVGPKLIDKVPMVQP